MIMVCNKCGNKYFFAKQSIMAHVVVNENGDFYANIPGGIENAICAAKHPIGPYCCTRCGEKYEEISDNITTVCCGITKTWGSRNDAISYFKKIIQTSKGAGRKSYVNVYTQLQNGFTYCSDKNKNKVLDI